MPTARALGRRGRRGRRTPAMIRVAHERIADLFGLADREVARREWELAHRYVVLARKVGMRYNVRLPREFRDRYCRACSAYWVESRTLRTRLRSGHRVQTCLRCGRTRRTVYPPLRGRTSAGESTSREVAPREDEVFSEPPSESEGLSEGDEDS